MSPRYRSLTCILLAGVCLGMIASTYAFAQGRGGGGGGMGGGRMGGGFPAGGGRASGGIGNLDTSTRSERSSGTRGGQELTPPGRWWNDKSFVKSLKLRPDQQTHMDGIFDQNRPMLQNSYLSLQQAEDRMTELKKSPNIDEAALNSQYERVAQARAELEKAYTHLQLQLRKEMDPEQLAKLDKQR